MLKIILLTILAAVLPPTLQAEDRNWGSGDWGGNDGGSFSNSCGTRDDRDRGGSRSLGVIGLTRDQRLVCFNEFSPGSASTIGTTRGFTGGDTMLVGIDFRVQDGRLYGLGNLGGVYTLNTTNAAATFVNRLTVALAGSSFGVDFNPAADRLRVISDTGQNLRHNVNPGGVTLVDGTLNYPSAAASPVAGPAAQGVTGAGYTNNDLDLTNTATTLYDIDSSLDQVAIQSPANSGFLAQTGKLTVDTNAAVGFDVYSTIRNNTTVDVQALASLTATNGSVSLYSINLPTGKATSRGSFSGQNQVIGIAIPLNQL